MSKVSTTRKRTSWKAPDGSWLKLKQYNSAATQARKKGVTVTQFLIETGHVLVRAV